MKTTTLSGEIIAVWWTDARGFPGPMSVEEFKQNGKGLPMLSVGLLVQDNESAILLAQDYYISANKEMLVRDCMVIPKTYIDKMRKWKI